MGRIQTACTQVGRDMMGLIKQGSQVAFSLRAQGNFHIDHQMNGAKVVEAPINIICYDWVINPSHSEAFIQSLSENAISSFFGKNFTQPDCVNRAAILTESEEVFNTGALIEINKEKMLTEAVDYASHSREIVKPLKHMYMFNESDKIVDKLHNNNVLMLESEGIYKKVTVEDYVIKDIRHRIRSL